MNKVRAQAVSSVAAAPDAAEVFDGATKLKLDKTHDMLDRPEKFAEFFKKCASNYTPIKDLLKSIIQEIIESDVDGKKAFRKLIREEVNEDWKAIISLLTPKIWGVFLILLGALIGFASSHLRWI